MKFGVMFAIQGLLLFVFGIALDGLGLALLWPGACLLYVAAAYLTEAPQRLGKRTGGQLHPLAVTLLLPWFLALWGVWHLARRLDRAQPTHRITDALLIGRRLLPDEVPDGVVHVLDLTCEFSEPSRIVDGYRWQQVPTLDGATPPERELLEALLRALEDGRPLYIHCAQGHGRTAIAAALALGLQGQANSPEDAIATLQSHRAGIRLSPAQRRYLDGVWSRAITPST